MNLLSFPVELILTILTQLVAFGTLVLWNDVEHTPNAPELLLGVRASTPIGLAGLISDENMALDKFLRPVDSSIAGYGACL